MAAPAVPAQGKPIGWKHLGRKRKKLFEEGANTFYKLSDFNVQDRGTMIVFTLSLVNFRTVAWLDSIEPYWTALKADGFLSPIEPAELEAQTGEYNPDDPQSVPNWVVTDVWY